MTSLEQTIIHEALYGFSKRECPGGFIAYIAKPFYGDARVEYVHCNTDARIHSATHKRIRAHAILALRGQA